MKTEEKVLNDFSYAYTQILEKGGKVILTLQEAGVILNLLSQKPDITEEEVEEMFDDWMGNPEPPIKHEDDPDYYDYSWGLVVWKAAFKQFKKRYEAS